MVDPRHAHGLVVSALVLGLSLGPAGPTRAASWARAETAAPEAKAPAKGTADPRGDEKKDAAPKVAEGADAPVDGAPADDGGGDVDAPDSSTAPEGDDAGTGTDEGATGSDTEPPAGDATDDAADPSAGQDEDPGAPDPDAVTVHPRAASAQAPAPAKSKPLAAVPQAETVVDPRRRDADGRLLVRAGLLSLGVAGLAVVPTVYGLQRAAHARGLLDDLETESEAGVRADVEAYEQRMNRLALAGGIVLGAQLVTGAILLGLGLRQRARARAEDDGERRHALAPAVGSGQLGVVWRARF